jgi:hypothetical protein
VFCNAGGVHPRCHQSGELSGRERVVCVVRLPERGAWSALVIGQVMILHRNIAQLTWAGISNLANGESLRSCVVAHFIPNGAMIFHRTVWLFVVHPQPGDRVGRFRSAYAAAENRAFGGYTAYRLIPK